MVVSTRASLHFTLGLLAAAWLALIATPAVAQTGPSLNDLRRENELLRQRIARLEAQVAQLELQNERLRDANARLRGEGGGEAAPDVVPGVDLAELPEGNPYATPGALLDALQQDFASQIPGEAPEDRTERRRMMRDVRLWVNRAARDFRGEANWLVKIDEIREADRGTELVFVVLDADSGKPYHTEPQRHVFRGSDARQIESLAGESHAVLRGMLNADPQINADRPDAGMFNTPPLIGPFTEFGYEFEIRSAEPAAAP